MITCCSLLVLGQVVNTCGDDVRRGCHGIVDIRLLFTVLLIFVCCLVVGIDDCCLLIVCSLIVCSLIVCSLKNIRLLFGGWYC